MLGIFPLDLILNLFFGLSDSLVVLCREWAFVSYKCEQVYEKTSRIFKGWNSNLNVVLMP